MKITIAGAGIGGLTTAVALIQKGFEVEIFEAAPEFKRAGSGINLAINAMQVYKVLGLYDVIFEAGSYTSAMNITDEKLNPISVIDLKHFEEKHKVQSVAIHRASLHKILLDQLADVPLHLGKKVKDVNEIDNEITLEFEDGTSHKTNVLIGADGIHSAIRKSIFDNTTIRSAKQICWRGITKIELPKKFQTELNEPWGKGKRFGFVAIGHNEYYWYALANYRENYQREYQDLDLVNFYSDFDPIVGQIIGSTAKENILTNEMLDLKPLGRWYKNSICLLGDSAHATTPNLGQGACQAIESSLAFANCFAKHRSTQIAFQEFQKIRMKKAVDVVNTSWRVGKIAHLQNNFLIQLRNFVMSKTPNSIANKQSERLYSISKY